MATPIVPTYDPGLVSCSFAGIIIQGFVEGSFLTIEQESANFVKKVGSDGTVARARSRNQSATATFKLLQTSKSNDDLSALANRDLAAPNGAGVGSFLVRDLSGRSLFRADAAWIAEVPKPDFGNEVGEREWKIDLAKIVRIDGGS